MSYLYRYPTRISATQGTVATLGNFDGIHLGHQELLAKIQEYKHSYKESPKLAALVLSFYPHPDVVLGKLSRAQVLCPLRRKLEILAKFEIDFLYLMRFTNALSKLRAADFIENILFKQLNVRKIFVGADASVGFKREGTPQFIMDYFEKNGREAEILEFKQVANERVSSGRVRSLLAESKVEEVALLLGRSYELRGKVIRGDGRGSSIGISTANLNTFDYMLPRDGVYACLCEVPGLGIFKALTNIGIRPTFSGTRHQVEAHLLDFTGANIYGQYVNMHFVSHLRSEIKFANAQALVEQIQSDIKKAREVFAHKQITLPNH